MSLVKMPDRVFRFAICLIMTCAGTISFAQAATVSEISSVSKVAPTDLASLPAVQPVVSCESLTKVDLGNVGGKGSRVTQAVETTRNAIGFCQVSGTLAPAVKFELLLPTKTWTQRYMQVGCGGLCGRISLAVDAPKTCVPLSEGAMVIAATDMGHEGDDVSWGDDKQKRIDFAYRAQHVTALAAKTLIQAFYGQPQRFAYFNGCSDGGREALMEAERFPKDFNGIIAGAPAMNFVVQNGIYHAWLAITNTGKDGKPILLASRLPILHAAVLTACDANDGTRDGLLSDPLACHFDPRTIQCRADAKDTSHCLTPAEVDVVRKFYAGPLDPKTGVPLSTGGPLRGSELAWAGVSVPYSKNGAIFSSTIALGALKGLLFPRNPPADFTLQDVKFDVAGFRKITSLFKFYNATNPDLRAFDAAGGKLILWQGWADPHISPLNTVAYQKALMKEFGQIRLNNFERYYMLPGVYHCHGGEGPDSVDFLTPAMSWVEKGNAPEKIITSESANASLGNSDFGAPGGPGARNMDDQSGKAAIAAAMPGKVDRTRPLFPFPYYAVYSGQGDMNSAESYAPRRGTDLSVVAPWAGDKFYTPFVPANDPIPTK